MLSLISIIFSFVEHCTITLQHLLNFYAEVFLITAILYFKIVDCKYFTVINGLFNLRQNLNKNNTLFLKIIIKYICR